MITNTQQYSEYLKKQVMKKISNDVNLKTLDSFEFKINSNFHLYYFETLNGANFLKKHFFKEFKQQYSLQGISNSYLDDLESKKNEIEILMKNDSIIKIYFDYFRKAKIKHKEIEIEKDLGSFFTKLVHTFKPHEYCALDNPIKKHLGLEKESFVNAFFIISEAYTEWSDSNQKTIKKLKEKLKLSDIENCIKHESITNHKLLDMIFWSIANN